MQSNAGKTQQMQNKKMKAAPQVRQTLASKYRLLKANPLLVSELEKKITTNAPEFVYTPLKTLVTVLDADSEVLSKYNMSFTTTQTLSSSTTSHRNDKSVRRSKSNVETSKREFAQPKDVPRKKIISKSNVQKNQLKESQSAPKLFSGSVDKNLNCASKNMKKDPIKRPVQPAKSNQAVKNKPVLTSLTNSQHNNSQQKDFKPQNNMNTKLAANPSTPGRNNLAVTPRFLNATCKELNNRINAGRVSVTPQNMRNTMSPAFSARRNQLFATPNNRRSVFVFTQTSNEVTQKLGEWLNHKGKSFKDYHHLKCFGVHADQKLQELEVEKENIQNSELSENNNSFFKAPIPDVNFSVVAQEALIDLHKLILDGYPPEQCEIWLRLIKHKCREVEDKAQYWECRAALEQTKGNINLAVECYKTAIIQGAEVQNVDKCLDQLLQKFSLLNISNETDSSVNKDERNKIVQDARNIFKSSIIQFAVQEKTLKKRNQDGVTIEKKVVATPVRRSTRLSRSAFTSTPGIHIYSSLQEIDTSVRDNLNFQCNNALKD